MVSPLYDSTDMGQVLAFNRQQKHLRTERVGFSIATCLACLGLDYIFKLRPSPAVRIGSFVLSITVLTGLYMRQKRSGISSWEDNKDLSETILLNREHREQISHETRIARLKLGCVALSLILATSTLFKFQAPRSIRKLSVVLSFIVFFYSYVTVPYIHLKDTPIERGSSNL